MDERLTTLREINHVEGLELQSGGGSAGDQPHEGPAVSVRTPGHVLEVRHAHAGRPAPDAGRPDDRHGDDRERGREQASLCIRRHPPTMNPVPHAHVAAQRLRWWIAWDWATDLMERFAEGRVDRCELGLE